MNELSMTNIDEITMRLVHYFITKENYQPIIVNGLENEVWLENNQRKYGVIRINTNYIHNNEQLDFDIFKAKTVMKQIKKKTLSFGTNILTILLNVGENVSIEDVNDKHFFIEIINDIDELENGSFTEIFPNIKDDVVEADTNLDFFINITNDINDSTDKRNELYEQTFKKKNIIVTYILMAISIIIFALEYAGVLSTSNFGVNLAKIKSGEVYRIFTNAFFHGKDIIFLFCGMYSLYILGKQTETYLGKFKLLFIYVVSILMSSLLTAVLNGSGPLLYGSAGSIFGLCGALLYFGYHFRVLFGKLIINQLIPIVLINIVLGFSLTGINAFSYIGGLVGGLFAAMIVGINGKTEKADTINGIIVTTILTIFLIAMMFFR